MSKDERERARPGRHGRDERDDGERDDGERVEHGEHDENDENDAHDAHDAHDDRERDESTHDKGDHGNDHDHKGDKDDDRIVCFADGTRIDTDAGPVPVEALRAGMMVRVAGADGMAPLRLNLCRRLSGLELMLQPKLRPVHIRCGALGPDLPNRDLRVSRQHRMLVASPICQRMFGCDEVLVPAIRLVGLPGCRIEPAPEGIAWHHLVFDRHQIVFANGAPSESFLPGPQAMQTIPIAAREELLALFPAIATPGGGFDPARPIPAAKAQRQLIDRHRENARALLANWHTAAA